MDINFLRGVMTVLWMLAFIGIVWWAWHPRTKARFDEAANLPFSEEKSVAAIVKTASTKTNIKGDQA